MVLCSSGACTLWHQSARQDNGTAVLGTVYWPAGSGACSTGENFMSGTIILAKKPKPRLGKPQTLGKLRCSEGHEKALPHGWPVYTTPNKQTYFTLPFISFQLPRNKIKLFYIQRFISALICFHVVILQRISPGPK